MTNIQLYTADRQLILLSQRVIASGERETVTLTVRTDAAWIGYRLSAIFFRDGQRELTVEVPLDAEGRCTVPRQLLAEPGVLQIGLRGLIGAEEEDIDADAACKTSTLVRYRIAEGTPPEADDRLVNPTNATADEDSVLAGETFYAGESGKPRTGNILTYEEGTPVSIDLTESDPTVPAWAKQPNKPTYTPDEIGAAPAGYGLGKTQSRGIPNNDVDDALENSWYVADASCKHNPFTGYGGNVFVYSSAFMIKQTWHQVSGARSVASRVKIGNTWSEWEYVNPPMQLGVEYLTNERFMGKPVYTMLIDLGETPVGTPQQKTDKEVILTVNGITRVIGYEFYFNAGNKDHPGLIYTFKGSDKSDSFMFWSYAWPDQHRLKIGLGSHTADVYTAYAIVQYLK